MLLNIATSQNSSQTLIDESQGTQDQNPSISGYKKAPRKHNDLSISMNDNKFSPFHIEVDYGTVVERNIGRVTLGAFEFDTWYGNTAYFNVMTRALGIAKKKNSPSAKSKTPLPVTTVPGEILATPSLVGNEDVWIDNLYLCDYCFKYSTNASEVARHRQMCNYRKILPGKEVFNDGEYSIRRISGQKEKLFCQCLCLFGGLFLESKTIYFDVEEFDFYVVYGASTIKKDTPIPMGFFSKELLSMENYNLACICVFPPFQRRQLGFLLISFSYYLSHCLEGIISGPEKPLTVFGRASYLKFWSITIAREILEGSLVNYTSLTIEDISNATGISPEDVLQTLLRIKSIDTEHQKAPRSLKEVVILKGSLKKWKTDNNIDFSRKLNEEYCLLKMESIK